MEEGESEASGSKEQPSKKEEEEEAPNNRASELQAEVFALAGEGLKKANSYLASENKRLIDRASNCMEEIIKWKKEAREAKEGMQAAEEKEKDRVKIINGLKKKIIELNEEIDVLFEKHELSKQVKEQEKTVEEEEKKEEEIEEKKEEGSQNEPGSSSTAPPATATPYQGAAAARATAEDTTTTTLVRQEEQPEEQKAEEEEEDSAPKFGEKEMRKTRKRRKKERKMKVKVARMEEKARKESKEERKVGIQESRQSKVTMFVSSQMLVSFGATTRTRVCTSVSGPIRKVARTYATLQ